MADYWKSQAKKFCDFCKCWIADNKPSVEFHERGKRHKENVEQRLNQIRKKGIEDYNAEQNMASDFQQMEEAALKAYEKDLVLNRDLTSQLYNASQVSESKDSECCKENEQISDVQSVEEKEEGKTEKKEKEEDHSAVASVKVWYEANTDEGYQYYWNIQTGESTWEPPEEGFVSVAEQEELYKQQKEAADTEEDSKTVDTSTGKQDETRSVEEEEEEEGEEEQLGTMIGPAQKPDPYGGWKTVKHKKAKTVDLQLPEQELVECRVPALSVEPSFKFKEKTVTSLCGSQDDGISVSFKKRKFAGNHKQNIRRRGDDD